MTAASDGRNDGPQVRERDPLLVKDARRGRSAVQCPHAPHQSPAVCNSRQSRLLSRGRTSASSPSESTSGRERGSTCDHYGQSSGCGFGPDDATGGSGRYVPAEEEDFLRPDLPHCLRHLCHGNNGHHGRRDLLQV